MTGGIVNGISQLPEHIKRAIELGAMAEFATVSAAGVPIDTPTYYFPSDDLSSLDVATGLAYPAKAERARRNPKVGMLVEAGADGPVILVRGRAAVRDANFAANAVRYLSETGFEGISYGLPWSEAAKAVWYWTRIIVEVTPERISWWDSPAEMDQPPSVWQAPANSAYPASDPPPPGKPSAPTQWHQRPWQEIAKDGFARGIAPHLTVCDDDGYPLPIRNRSCELIGDRFRMEMPRHLPWEAAGKKATLSFIGLETFVGDVAVEGGVHWLAVERALPESPLMRNPREVLQPSPEIRAKLMARLEVEVARRGQTIPDIPDQIPAPTRLAAARFAHYGKSAPTVEGTVDATPGGSA